METVKDIVLALIAFLAGSVAGAIVMVIYYRQAMAKLREAAEAATGAVGRITGR